MRQHIKTFANDESASVLDVVLVVGIISLPLIMFLAMFGENVVKWVQDHAPDIFKEASGWLG